MKYKHKDKHKVAVFDLDGTLIDSKRKIINDAVGAFRKVGIKVSSEQVRKMSNWHDFAYIHGVSKEEFDTAFDKRKSWEQALKEGEIDIFPDTYNCLENLRNNDVRMALLSRSIPKYTMQKLVHFDLDKYFNHVATTLIASPSKRKEAVGLIKHLIPESIEKAYFIGDRKEDIIIAEDIKKELGVPSKGIGLIRKTGDLGQELMPGYTYTNSLNEVLKEIIGESY